MITKEEAARELLSRKAASRSLHEFVRQAWPWVEGGREFTDGWVIGAICEHLQAVKEGQIERLLINQPPRTMKPVWEEEFVITRRGRIRLKEVKVGDFILTHRNRFRRVNKVYSQGELLTLNIKLWDGRSVCAAPDHPFLTPNGWVKAADLKIEDVVALVPPTVFKGATIMSDEEARLLGYFIGDGCVTGTAANITFADDIIAEDIERCARAIGFYTGKLYFRKGTSRVTIVEYDKSKGETYKRLFKGERVGAVKKWLMTHELRGKSSYTKRVPPTVWNANNDAVINFIGAYWACDGYISGKGRHKNGDDRTDLIIGCDSVSEQLLIDIQHLLLRLGIRSRVRKKVANIKTKKQGDTYTSYHLCLKSQDDVWKFTHTIPIFHKKSERLKEGYQRRYDFDREIYPDVVIAKEDSGSRPCRCLEVEEDHTFTVNDIAVHNSLTASVFFPAWWWTQDQTIQFLCGTHSFDLAMRDSLKCRRLIQSDWYQARYGVRLTDDQSRKERFDNTGGGTRVCITTGSKGQGENADCQILDDPNDANEISDTTLNGVNEWVSGVYFNRANNRKKERMVVSQQRLHENDVSGYILSHYDDSDWVKLILPMEYEPDRRYYTIPLPSTNGKPWCDPRKKRGELLWPERVGEKELEKIKKDLQSAYKIAGQLQQRPAPAEGGIFKKSWFKLWGANRPLPDFQYIIQSYDTAVTADTQNDPTAGETWGIFKEEGRWCALMLDCWTAYLEYPQLKKRVVEAFHSLYGDPPKEVDLIVIEDKSSGASLRRDLSQDGLPIKAFKTGKADKVQRAHMVTHLAENGLIYVLESNKPERKGMPVSWAEAFLDEITMFPNAKHDDLVDAAVQCWSLLKDMKLIAASAGSNIDEDESEYKESWEMEGVNPYAV